jgi:hypothetical protein
MDEMWIHHYAPESKRQGMEWKHKKSPVKKKFKTQPSVGKVMLTLSGMHKGYCQKMLECHMIISICALSPTSLKAFTSYTLSVEASSM